MTTNAGDTLRGFYEAERQRIQSIEPQAKADGDFLHPVFGSGSTDAALMLIGEAPGAEEAAAGRPFVGKAGKQLDELLGDAGIDRSQVYISNVVKYRPVVRSERSVRNRTPSLTEINAGLPLLRQEIDLVEPLIIATLGNTPLKAMLLLTGTDAMTIGSCHGMPWPVRLDGRFLTLFPLYHPASGIYNRALIDVMHRDARLLSEHLVKD